MKKRYPIGIQNFDKLRLGNLAFMNGISGTGMALMEIL